MRRRNFLKNGAILMVGMATTPLIYPFPNKGLFIGKEERVTSPLKNNLQVLVLDGLPRKRGQIHGEALRSKIKEAINRWKEFFPKFKHMNQDEYISKFLEETNFLPAIKKWTPDLLEEVKGIGEGAGVDFKTIYAYQLMDEEWLFRRKTALEAADQEGCNCSSLGVFKQASIPVMVAQNMDIPNYADGFQVLLHIKHPNSSLEILAFTYTGLIILNGMNSRPVGVCCNTLSQLNYSFDGLPVAFVLRGILQQLNHEEAIKFIHQIKHASGQNYIIGGKEKVSDYECSANKVSRFIPYDGANRVYHTNHPFVNDDRSIYREIQKKLSQEKETQGSSNSEIRFRSLETRLRDPEKTITVETVKSVLSSHDHPKYPVCRHKIPEGGAMTLGSMIMVLSSSPEMILAPGPPCLTEYMRYKFSSDS